MTVTIGGPGDRRRAVFGPNDTGIDAILIERYDSEGVEAFDTDVRGVLAIVKRRPLFIHALDDHGSVGSLANALGLKAQFVLECAWYWRLDEEGLVDEPPNPYSRPTTAPWLPNPHPDTVAKAGGSYSKTHWE